MSKGYVQNTDVIPAEPPQTRRLMEVRSAPGEGSKNCLVSVTVLAPGSFASFSACLPSCRNYSCRIVPQSRVLCGHSLYHCLS